MGTLYESCNNQVNDALDAYSRALELDPTNPHIKQRLQMLRSGQSGGPPPSAMSSGPHPMPQDVGGTSFSNQNGAAVSGSSGPNFYQGPQPPSQMSSYGRPAPPSQPPENRPPIPHGVGPSDGSIAPPPITVNQEIFELLFSLYSIFLFFFYFFCFLIVIIILLSM